MQKPSVSIAAFGQPALDPSVGDRLDGPLALLAPVLRQLRGGSLHVTLPHGGQMRLGESEGDGPAASLHIRDLRFVRRVLVHGDVGFAESYADGDWDTPDLPGILTFLASQGAAMTRAIRGGPITRLAGLVGHAMRANTRAGSRRNILAHYDLGNEFFSLWLDPSMTYSSAVFRNGLDLESAQIEKYAAIARLLELRPGETVLEIGCGWGGFAEYAAREHGARVRALTISDAQFAFANARIARAGLGDRVEIVKQDYRAATGAYDKIASIEMLEAVGERNWPVYFGKLRDLLKPGGQAAVQVITIADEHFPSYRRRADFIQRCVFPGGMLPSPSALRAQVDQAGLAWRAANAYAEDYARTLLEWLAAFDAKRSEISRMGYDTRFQRLWRFYLAYCVAGFRSGRTDLVQFSVARP